MPVLVMCQISNSVKKEICELKGIKGTDLSFSELRIMLGVCLKYCSIYIQTFFYMESSYVEYVLFIE